MSNFKDKLSAMANDWEDSQGAYDQQFGDAKIPPGVYLARLRGAKLKENSAKTNLMILREHIILDGEAKNMVCFDNMMLGSAQNMVYVRRWIEMMGFQNPENPSEIESTIDAMVKDGATLKIRISQDGAWTNADVIEVVDSTVDGGSKESHTAEPKEETVTTDADLAAFCKTYEIEVVDGNYTAALDGYDWDANDLSTDEVVMLQNIDVTMANAPEPEEENSDLELLTRLGHFCTAQDISFEKDDDVEMFKERINGFEYPENEITDDEKALLLEIGQEDNIKAVKKAPPAKKASPAKKAPGRKAPPKKKG